PVTAAELKTALTFYKEGREQGGFEAGIEAALAYVLVSPSFLFRVEEDPEHIPPNTPYRISDLQLASRLSFLIWSSLPDDRLLDLAARGDLSKPEVLEGEVRRMLADPRSASLAVNFGGQWLHLRNVDSLTPDVRLFPDFDDNLRQALRRETELCFERIIREDKSIIELIRSNDTYLNNRLAQHYGIPGVEGSHFRRVSLRPEMRRGGLLRHGSVLAVTSYATRTSPVLRGNWILGNILGTPPPPPPPDVPALDGQKTSAGATIRQRLAEHRANPACASCHDVMDPVGFALENFDAVGRWRDFEDGRAVDAAGGFPDGSRFEGVDALERAILQRPKIFVGTFAEKLLTFGLGRGVTSQDAPAVRSIVAASARQGFRFSDIVLAVANSKPFQMRKTSP
ncbi:MAG: DUF1592 domain-containing protein, partial [Verrucomicrobia bacterium]|nr:DUF1592 domain-containing protein [Verrucomicrobiota bacterium]